MKNLITKGSRCFFDREKYVKLIINEDHPVIGKVYTYDPSIAKITFTKIWDEETADENKKHFFAWARYENATGSPPQEEVITGGWLPFFRIGEGNNNFTAMPTAAQLHDPQENNKASFVAFFVKPIEE